MVISAKDVGRGMKGRGAANFNRDNEMSVASGKCGNCGIGMRVGVEY